MIITRVASSQSVSSKLEQIRLLDVSASSFIVIATSGIDAMSKFSSRINPSDGTVDGIFAPAWAPPL